MGAIWATPVDVQNLTGAIAYENDIAVAQAIVDLYADLDSDDIDLELIWEKDLVRLKKATCYQTKFMQSQPDLLGRQDVKGVSQDGVSSVYTNPDAVILAPLARVAIGKLRWKRARALHPNRRGRNMLALQQTWVRDAEPDHEMGWQPISGGGWG
jgi:hypothetical protein